MLAACSSETDRRFKQAKLAASKGDFTKAIQLYSGVLKEQPSNAAALAGRGLLYERLPVKDVRDKAKNLNWAERDYVAAIKADPKMAEVYNNLGALYIDKKQYADAIYYLSAVLNFQPDYFMARLNRAIAYHQQGRLSESLGDFARAFALDPHSPLLYLNRGLAFFEAGDYESAASDFSDLIVLKPQSARAYLERGRALMKMGYMGDAEADFETAAGLKPSYVLPYYYLSEMAFLRGDMDQAMAYIQHAKTLSGKYVPAYELAGDMLALEDPLEATKNYLAARKLDPQNAARYQWKIRMMKTEAGRQRVIKDRFLK